MVPFMEMKNAYYDHLHVDYYKSHFTQNNYYPFLKNTLPYFLDKLMLPLRRWFINIFLLTSLPQICLHLLLLSFLTFLCLAMSASIQYFFIHLFASQILFNSYLSAVIGLEPKDKLGQHHLIMPSRRCHLYCSPLNGAYRMGQCTF